MPAARPDPTGDFTGVDWYARPTQQLVTDLGLGIGVAQLAEAARTAAESGTGYRSAADELGRLCDRLDGAVIGGHDAESTGRQVPPRALVSWLHGHGEALTDYAEALERQTRARETVDRAIPAESEVAALRADRAALAADPLAAGGVLIGKRADLEAAADEAHHRAAAAMDDYERASFPLRRSWNFGDPPAPGDRSPRKRTGRTGTRAGGGGSASAGTSAGAWAGSVPTPLRAFPYSSLLRQSGTPGARPAVTAGGGERGAMPMSPAMMGAGMGAAAAAGATTRLRTGGPAATESESPDAFVVHAPPPVGEDGALAGDDVAFDEVSEDFGLDVGAG